MLGSPISLCTVTEYSSSSACVHKWCSVSCRIVSQLTRKDFVFTSLPPNIMYNLFFTGNKKQRKEQVSRTIFFSRVPFFAEEKTNGSVTVDWRYRANAGRQEGSRLLFQPRQHYTGTKGSNNNNKRREKEGKKCIVIQLRFSLFLSVCQTKVEFTMNNLRAGGRSKKKNENQHLSRLNQKRKKKTVL